MSAKKMTNEEKLASLKERLAKQVAKIAKAREDKAEIVLEIKRVMREMNPLTSGRGRGSENFGKVLPAVKDLLETVDGNGMTTGQLAKALNLPYGAVFGALNRNKELFEKNDKLWKVKESQKEQVVEPQIAESVAA